MVSYNSSFPFNVPLHTYSDLAHSVRHSEHISESTRGRHVQNQPFSSRCHQPGCVHTADIMVPWLKEKTKYTNGRVRKKYYMYPIMRYSFSIFESNFQSHNIYLTYSTIYILSVYSPFSDRVGLPPYNAPFPGVLMKSISDAILGAHHKAQKLMPQVRCSY